MTDKRTIVDRTLVPHLAFEEASRRLDQCFRYADGAGEPICLAIIGESRTGKSRAVEEYESRHRPVRDTEGLTSAILRVKTPSKPTVKSLAELLLRELKDPLFDKGTENAKTIRLKRLMQQSQVMMVIIDEFQHFVDKGSQKVMHHVADWLKVLVDDSRVALVVAGLPTCQAVLEQNEQLAGRFLAPVMMPRFNWHNDAEREEFMDILGAFHESISEHFDLPALDSSELAFRCYCATGGLIGYLSKFLRQAAWNAIDANKHSIELADLARAHDEAVWGKNGPIGIPSPFTHEFVSEPTEDLLARIMRIGTPVEHTLPRHMRARRSEEFTIQQVLAAH